MNKINQSDKFGKKIRWSFFLVIIAAALIYSQQKVDGKEAAASTRFVPDNLFGISSNDSGLMVVAGYYGTTFVSDDFGDNWRRVESPSRELIRRTSVSNRGAILSAGSRGGVYLSKDKGATWKEVYTSNKGYLRDIRYITDEIAIAVGKEGSILRSSDEGVSWEPIELKGVTTRDIPTLNGLAHLGEENVVAVGEFGSIAVSRDNGLSWKMLGRGDKKTLTSVSYDKANDYGIAVGLDGALVRLKLRPTKLSVKEFDTNIPNHLFDISIVDGEAFIVGQGIAGLFDGEEFVKKEFKTKNFDLNYSWLHGVRALANGEVIAVGRFGSVVYGDANNFPSGLKNMTGVNYAQKNFKEGVL